MHRNPKPISSPLRFRLPPLPEGAIGIRVDARGPDGRPLGYVIEEVPGRSKPYAKKKVR